MPIGRPIDLETKKNIVEYYKSNPMTIKSCAKNFNLSIPSVIKILDEFKIERYKKSNIYNPKLNEDYFNIIDREEKAYYLGFLISDGNIYKDNSGSNRQSSISITQSEQDKYILEKFLAEINANTSVTNDGRGTCQVAVRSNIMANDLETYSVFPNKTLNTRLPMIDDSLMNHLIRGILDGDGSITSVMLKSNKHKHAISFCGTHELMEDISNYISAALNVINPKVYDYEDRYLSEIKWQSISDCYAVGNWLYNGSSIYLERKYKIFCDFKQYYNLT